MSQIIDFVGNVVGILSSFVLMLTAIGLALYALVCVVTLQIVPAMIAVFWVIVAGVLAVVIPLLISPHVRNANFGNKGD